MWEMFYLIVTGTQFCIDKCVCVLTQWLNEEKVIQRLVDMVQPSQDEDVSQFLFILLAAQRPFT